MNIKNFILNDKWILIFFASLLAVLALVAVSNLNGNYSINDIQSFKVVYLDEGKEIQSDNPKYCRFLEMYFDSFSAVEVDATEEHTLENLENTHSIKVVASCLNDIEYIVYLDMENDIAEENEYKFFDKAPAKWVVENVKDSNVFIITGSHSSKLVQIFTEINAY